MKRLRRAFGQKTRYSIWPGSRRRINSNADGNWWWNTKYTPNNCAIAACAIDESTREKSTPHPGPLLSRGGEGDGQARDPQWHDRTAILAQSGGGGED